MQPKYNFLKFPNPLPQIKGACPNGKRNPFAGVTLYQK